jgi:dipeptidyl-peptidase-4
LCLNFFQFAEIYFFQYLFQWIHPDIGVKLASYLSRRSRKTTGNKDDQYFGWPIWRKDGSSLLVQWINRGQDHLKVFDVNPSNGTKKIMYEEQQKTWVDLEDNAGERFHFLEQQAAFILESDKTGWKHLYLYKNDGNLISVFYFEKYQSVDQEEVKE